MGISEGICGAVKGTGMIPDSGWDGPVSEPASLASLEEGQAFLGSLALTKKS
jgi:hypothetical protein